MHKTEPEYPGYDHPIHNSESGAYKLRRELILTGMIHWLSISWSQQPPATHPFPTFSTSKIISLFLFDRSGSTGDICWLLPSGSGAKDRNSALLDDFYKSSIFYKDGI